MLPGFSADDSLYQSQTCYVSGVGGMCAAGDIAPAARTLEGFLAGILIGGLIGSRFGEAGGIIGAVIGGIYCFFFDCPSLP